MQGQPQYFLDYLNQMQPYGMGGGGIIGAIKNFISPPKPKPAPQITIKPGYTPPKNPVNNLPLQINTPISGKSASFNSFVAPNANGQKTTYKLPDNTTSQYLSPNGKITNNFNPSVQSPQKGTTNFSSPVTFRPSTSGTSFSDLLNQLNPLTNRTLGGQLGSAIDRFAPIAKLSIPFLSAIPDYNLSESLQSFGGNTQGQPFVLVKSAYVDTGKGSNTLDTNQQLKQTPITNGRMSIDPNAKKKMSVDKGNTDKAINDYNNYVNQDPGNFKSNQDNLGSDFYATLNDQAAGLYNQDFSSEADYYNQLAALQDQQNNATYDALVKSYQDQVPGLQADTQRLVDSQKSNLADLNAQGAAAKEDQTNIYGDLVKKIVNNTTAAKNQLSNIFSGLGTVDSSAFLNQSGALANTQNTDVANTERDLGKSLSTIQNQLLDAQKQTNDIIGQIQSDGQKKIDAINSQINLTQADRASKLAEINIQLNDAINQAKQFYEGKKADLLNNQINLANSKQLIDYQTANDITAQNAATQNQIKLSGIVGNNIDPTTDAQLNQLAKNRINYAPNNSSILAIMQKTGMSFDQVIQALRQRGYAG